MPGHFSNIQENLVGGGTAGSGAGMHSAIQYAEVRTMLEKDGGGFPGYW
jgi:hypothetical protein